MFVQKLKIGLAQNGAWIALLVVVVIFSAVNPRFLTVGNFEAIIRQVAELGLIALALGFVIMSASIDLSVGSIASLAAVVSAITMIESGSMILGLLAGLLVGLLAGALNGLLISILGFNPIVITLGFLAAWSGLALYLTNGKTLVGLPEEFGAVFGWKLGPLSTSVLVLVVAIVLGWYLLNHRPAGRWVLGVGENDRSAFLMGIPVKRTRFVLFVISGVVAALAGILIMGKLQAAPPAVGSGMELGALTVVLLGGVGFAGGSGRVGGIIAGLLLVGTLRNGLVIAGVSQFLQEVAVGLTLVVAIALDGTLMKIITSSWNQLGKESLQPSARDEDPEPSADAGSMSGAGTGGRT